MGLDGIELVMAVEESFQLKFEEETLSEITTVGDLYQLILKSLTQLNQLGHSNKTGCLTSHTFYQLRKALINKSGIPRCQLFPKQKMVTLFPKPKRRTQWKAFAKELGLQLPELHRPIWFSSLLTYGVLSWLIGSVLGAVFDWLSIWQAGISIGLALGFAWFAYWLSKPLANHFESETLGEITQIVLYQNLSKLRSSVDKKQWNEKEVWEIYQQIIVQELGVKPQEVVKSARFVEDLGVD